MNKLEEISKGLIEGFKSINNLMPTVKEAEKGFRKASNIMNKTKHTFRGKEFLVEDKPSGLTEEDCGLSEEQLMKQFNQGEKFRVRVEGKWISRKN